ncbi:hypothetical protein [Paenibacillus glacialis]|uniref:Uncharacterized protein n=1 Tax=Paenibacillus glacialis TaxID=494026 RepID=A0A162LXZ5_9BACL|nr:hypothetical protein [Paenibacillus glacialis]OAB35933.1 hypothetical protein PGLA_21120 [Paenibacillus glacialis]
MRPYYLLTEDHRITNKIAPKGKEMTDSFNILPPLSVVQVNHTSPEQYLDWFIKPRLMMSDDMKNTLVMYNPKMECKHMDLVDQQHSQYTYWSFNVPSVDCLSMETEFYPDGRLKKLVLDHGKIKRHHFFTIQGIMEPYHIISLDAAESLLRRGMTGFILENVIQSGGGKYEHTLG